jgi:drug/metabolite transporter (DMT)-like permease
VAVMLLYTSPVFVMLMSALCFKEKLSLCKSIACALAIAGCAAISGIWQGKLNIPLAVLLTGLGSGLGYALYSIFGRYARNAGANSVTITLWTMIFALAGTVWLADFSRIATAAQEGKFYLCAAGLALFSTLLPYYFYTSALKKLETSSCAVLAAVEPVTGCLIGFFFWKEDFSFSILLGIVLILSALILAGWEKDSGFTHKKTAAVPDPNGVNAETN